jgi:predicted deacetylase
MPSDPILLASIHDVGPRFAPQVDALIDRLAPHVGLRLAMLVVPDHWDAAPLARDRAFARRLRGWADAGVEMFVHGWSHRDAAPKGFAATRMTAGEGEFSALGRAEALARMRRARAVVEDATGSAAAGFIAPAWLYSDGARAALTDAGFALAEDHFRVWTPADGRVVARGPVITWASRSRWRRASSLAVAAAARALLGGQRVVRVAVHPGDTGEPSLLASIDATLSALLRGRRPGRYAELAPVCANSAMPRSQ